MAQGFGQDIQKQSPRVSQLKRKLDGSEDADLIMMSILEVFKDIEYVPDPGNYYTFIYYPKTEGIRYDASLEAMQGLKTLFEGGVITAGTASQISDIHAIKPGAQAGHTVSGISG